ncbi:MAG: hypothetical protein JW910_18150, partial [Anaerolineae bacterium]|nr:hypothetical protein [Anaerolineae bacterium]
MQRVQHQAASVRAIFRPGGEGPQADRQAVTGFEEAGGDMGERGEYTLAEILSQPTVWQDALAVVKAQAGQLMALWQDGAFDQIIFTGCGSTYYLA